MRGADKERGRFPFKDASLCQTSTESLKPSNSGEVSEIEWMQSADSGLFETELI